jgi:hypothetical protein
MTHTTKTSRPVVIDLIPWDFTSPAHRERMLAQRKACGWGVEDVPGWVEKGEKGAKVLYWLVSSQLQGPRLRAC